MNYLLSLEHWDHRFQSHWWHWCLSAFILSVQAAALWRLIPRQRSPTHCLMIKKLNWIKAFDVPCSNWQQQDRERENSSVIKNDRHPLSLMSFLYAYIFQYKIWYKAYTAAGHLSLTIGRWHTQLHFSCNELKNKNNHRGLSPQARYTDRAPPLVGEFSTSENNSIYF